ncbi:MAG: cyclase family protein [Gemmatimonadetes bacterium]|nr:cyclase family protein [Gemmatimonadota bacterium]
MKATFIDLSHAVEDGMITHPGLPGPRVEAFLSRADSRKNYAPGTEFHIGRIEMVANTGTYVDAPFHRFDRGKDLAELPLASLADLPGVKFHHDSQQGCGVGPGLFQGWDLAGKAVLIETGWSAHWGTPRYLEANPFLTREAAEFLRDVGAALVGIDSVNLDDLADRERPAHTVLLGADIPVAEHLCGLDVLPEQDFRFFAVPVKVRGLGTFPVRAFAIIPPGVS